MPSLDSINKWMTLVSNPGVAAGFVLLATQLRQRSEAMRLQQLTSRYDSNRATAIAMLGENPHAAFAAAMLRPSELSADEVTQLWGQLEVYVIDAEASWVAYQAGYQTEADWELAKRAAVARVIWSRLKSTYRADLVRKLDAGLAQASDVDWPGAYREIMADLRALPNAPPDAPGAQE